MSILRPALTFLCAAGILGAQSAVDLNGLAVAASHYASHGLQGQRSPAVLDLRVMRGDNGQDPMMLMQRATDVQRWTIFYDASYKRPLTEQAATPRSASVKCVQGMFSDFFMSPETVPDCKSMEYAWLAVSLDSAIAQLNAQGYVRGFSQVDVKNPDQAGIPQGLVYIFTCPWERTRAAISATTGQLSWIQMY